MRVREFTLAEIEHFVDPENKSHPKFSEVANLEFLMFPREEQMSGHSAKKIPLGEAVSRVGLKNICFFPPLLCGLVWLGFSSLNCLVAFFYVTMLWLNFSRELSTMKLLATLLGEYICS